MAAFALVAAAGAAGIALMLALKLRGPRGDRDLICPPGPRKLSREQVQSLADLVARGEEAEALRMLRSAGWTEEDARQAIGLVERFAGRDSPE
jgi:hypothetical protein